MDIAVDTITELVLRLKALEVKEGITDPDSGSNPIDDGATDVLTSGTDDATESEVRGLIRGLNDDQRANLLALLYVGRGDYDARDWDGALAFARDRQAAGDGAIKELLHTPNAADLLEEGLDALGVSQDISET
ncbi:DUF3775 domain-containing protein [Methylobacterium sp. C25]|uniref:DUF3775 domain-containing protein n=1 Tax=Methylobacterium sp. C25 TaxID=2721622 RepID=UPI001F24DC3B|nr:DUF3775 domain-containing protein [Methylobacterium sp. C25]MCE4224399.1 DUF3775 domain-containing protein [Methylobacterium sp. C25]